MKSKKVLLGLIVASFVGFAGISSAQTKANYQNNLIEIGPDNIGGRTRAIVADQRDASHKTLYAGGVAGGLYKFDADAAAWSFIPCTLNGKQVTLPISAMVQTPDNMIYIATGEGIAVTGLNNSSIIAPKGRGLYRFNPEDNSFALVSGTANWEYINKLAFLYRDGKLYFYAATNNGLYRWKVNQGAEFGNPSAVWTEGPVQDVEIVSGDNMAFFTSDNKLFKVGNVTGESNAVNLTATNPAFAYASRIEIAAAKAERTYLYASVASKTGMLEGVYVSYDQQNWNRITTSTIAPFTSMKNGWHSNALTIDPTNYKRIMIGGASIWVGEGLVEGSYYMWNKTSNYELELGNNNYMENVYPSSFFVHSGIHQILPVPQISEEGDTTWVYYMATDGGIFKTENNFNSFIGMNKGFNTVQFNGIAVAPDGSVLGGAFDNACPFIQARLTHHNGHVNNTWYDNGSTMNHIGNVLWFGDGGQVEASMFQQVLPNSRRGLFFSSEGAGFTYQTEMSGMQPVASYGRAYADYADWSNTQTWTTGSSFLETALANTNQIPQMALWETLDNKGLDSINFTIDVLGTITRNGQTMQLSDTFAIKAGDKIIVGNRAHFGYPFEYTFDHNFIVANEPTHRVHSPIASRMFVTGKTGNGQGVVHMTSTPSDYSKVYTSEDAGSSITMHWYDVFKCPGGAGHAYQTVGQLAVANNGDAVFVNVIDTLGKHFILRISNLNAANVNNYSTSNSQLNYEGTFEGMSRITSVDTIFLSGDNYQFDRPISSMFIDKHNNKDVLMVTLSGDTNSANLYIVNNANNPASRNVTAKTVKNGRAIYSGIIEYTTGKYIIGTDNGVFTCAENGNNWEEIGDFDGVPVTSIRQQTSILNNSASYMAHSGINEEFHVYAKTKYPYAVYYGTYGRGIFLDMQYCTDTTNEIIPEEYYSGITNVNTGVNTISVYPNPATNYANINMAIANEGNAAVKVYDLSGKLVFSQNLGHMTEGEHNFRLDVQNFRHGMYLVNVICGNQAATSKLIVR